MNTPPSKCFHNGIILIVICFILVSQIYEMKGLCAMFFDDKVIIFGKIKTVYHEKDFRAGFRYE